MTNQERADIDLQASMRWKGQFQAGMQRDLLERSGQGRVLLTSSPWKMGPDLFCKATASFEELSDASTARKSVSGSPESITKVCNPMAASDLVLTLSAVPSRACVVSTGEHREVEGAERPGNVVQDEAKQHLCCRRGCPLRSGAACAMTASCLSL